MRPSLRLIIMCLAMATLVVGVASAHGDHEVGDYIVTFGWRNEPAYAGLINGPEIFISQHAGETDHDDHSAETTLAGVDIDLRAEVRFGPAVTTVFFRPSLQRVGHFIADLIPTMPGDYVFHVTGNIGDTPVDLTFDSADSQFSTVEPLADVLFPAPDMDAAARIADLEARLADLEARLAILEGR